MELISKYDVIKALQKWNCRDSISLTINPYEVLRDIPTIEERKEGEWIKVKTTRGGYECSKCHNYAPSYQGGSEHLSNYCPNCGARMKGDIR